MGPRRRERGIMATPDYCRMLLKESRAKAACLCIHHDTSVEFGGWAKCANASIPSDRVHAVKTAYLSDCNQCAYTNVDSGSLQKPSNTTSTKPAQRLAVFRRKADKKTEEECLRFCHLESTSDHIRHYRERKHGLFVEKVPNNCKVGPPLRIMRVSGSFQDVCLPDLESEVNRPASSERFTTIRKLSKFHRVPLVIYNSNGNKNDIVVDSGIGRPQVIGKAALMCSEGDPVTRKWSKGSCNSIGSLAQFTVSEQPAEFSAWVPENAIYQNRSSSAKMYNSVGYLKSDRPKEGQPSSTFQPLQLHTSHLRKSKYPPSLLFHEKQEDQIMVKSSRSKDGKVHTRIEFFSMTAPEQQQSPAAEREKRVHYLEPLSADSEEKSTNKKATKGADHCDLVDYSESRHQKHESYLRSGRLLSGRIKSGTQQVTEEDLQQLAIGKHLASDDNATQLLLNHNSKNRARRKFYHIEKQDSARSIPSKSIARSNLCDLQIQPSVSSSALIHQDNNSDITVSSLSSTHYHSQRRDREGILEDSQTTKQECINELIVNCPTVVNSSLLASPYKSHSGTNDLGRVLSSVERHAYPPRLRKSGYRKSIHSLNSPINSYGKAANQILLNSHTERFLPSSKQHGRIKLSHALTDRKEGSSTGYRVTLSGNNVNSADIHHQVNDSSRCLLRSRQRRKVQLQKNILGNLSSKKVEHHSLRAYKKAHQPVKVCLRGTRKKLIDLLRTNSSNSVLDSSELPELYAE